jgi:TolB protein
MSNLGNVMKKLICMAMMLFSTGALCEVLKVEGAKYKALAIALPDPRASVATGLSTQLSKDLIATVRSDLSWSAVFDVLDPRSYVADLSKEGLDKKSIRVESWTQIGADALVKMQLVVNGQDLTVDVAIHPLVGQKASGRKSFNAPTSQVKRLAHQISDEILNFFTGEPGIFNTQIVAARETSNGKHLVVLDVDGLNERSLTKGSGPHILPTFAPEGDTVLYTAFNDHNANLMQINVDGSNPKVLSSRPDANTGAQISPDRRQMAFTVISGAGSQVYLGDRSARNVKKITDSFGINISPSFTPDGSKIAFVSSRGGNPQIYMMDVNGQNAKRLTFQGKYNQTPRVSPKGDYIAFTGRDERNVFDLFLLQISTGTVSRITQDQGNNEDPWFSPNGRLIVFTSTRDGKRELYVSNLDGSMQKRVTSGGGYYTPSWGPSK